jgi:hypothetical protein
MQIQSKNISQTAKNMTTQAAPDPWSNLYFSLIRQESSGGPSLTSIYNQNIPGEQMPWQSNYSSKMVSKLSY